MSSGPLKNDLGSSAEKESVKKWFVLLYHKVLGQSLRVLVNYSNTAAQSQPNSEIPVSLKM